MKYILSLFGAIVFTANCYSQTNLVNNGSFESYSNCPTAFSQIEYANGWKRSYMWNTNTSNWHVEYFNSCNSGNWVGMPVNGWGNQQAFDGNGYIAQAPTCPLTQANYRENVYTMLSTPLVIGNTYRVSYRVSLGDECKYATNNICAKFGTDTVFAIDNSAVCVSGFITDKINWTLVTNTFTADSAYSYLCIGNFFDDANTMYVQSYPSSNNNNGTYYIDSVQVYQVGENGMIDPLAQLRISLSPNPANDHIVISGLKEGLSGALELFDMEGKLIASWQLEPSDQQPIILEFPCDIPKGLYLVRFHGEVISSSEKLVIE